MEQLEVTFGDFLKRVFDIAASFWGLVLLSPIMLVIAAIIKLDSPGPVFYRGVRVGRYGKPFRIFKFRTMVVGAEKIGGHSASEDDPRIIKAGKFLRKHKLDELPQLINVLTGEMSFVGPRPEVQYYVDMFTEKEKSILTVRPGITDWASLWNYDQGAILVGISDPDKAFLTKIRPEKIRLQLKYVREHSLLVDLKIILETIWALISKNSELPDLNKETN